MDVIRWASLTPIPWKNGGGVTHEVIRMPATGDPFRWRVSIARIEAPGPFSNFAGYQRTMVLLHGAGMRLNFGDGQRAELHEMGSLVTFDGALAPYCELTGGPCMDLNLMTATALTTPRAWLERLHEPRWLGPSAHAKTLALAIDGRVSVTADHGESTRLGAWDLAVMSPAEGGTVGPEIHDSAAPLVFFATLEDDLDP
jgi:environmental stress-induced protein Ves